MLLESSEEEEEEETEEVQAPSGLDASEEAAATAARFLAKSASTAYLQKLQEQCLAALEKPELQKQQLEALAAHAARHPEMQPKRPPQPDPGSQSPAASAAPHTAASPAASHAPSSPAPQPSEHADADVNGKEELAEPESEVVVASLSPKTARSPKRGARSPGRAPKPRSPSPKVGGASPSSPKPQGTRRKQRIPRPSEASKDEGAPAQSAPAAKEFEMIAGSDGKLSWCLATTASTVEQTPKVAASQSFQTDLSAELRLQAAYGTSSLTQLPSSTWRGPDETYANEREMFLTSLSKHKSMPLITFLPRRSTTLWVTNSNPAPGTYPAKDESRTSKYQAPRQVSFGFNRRFSRWPQNAEKKPGPGAHSVANFERFKYKEPTGSSFSRAPRGRPNPIRQHGPGPGAYGVKFGSAEEGPAVTMVGKFRKRGVLNYDEPGPGAYDPSTVLCEPTSASVGFATALREDFYPKEDKQKPAPGAYHDGFLNNPLGSDCLAFSMTGKRRKHDLTRHLYAEPGPGFYKHGSSFGYTGTWMTPQAAADRTALPALQ